MVLVNDSPDDELLLTNLALENIVLTLKKGNVINFKVKFPRKATVAVIGNKLNQAAKHYTKNSQLEDVIQIFDIKTDVSIQTIDLKIITLK
jgi:hypothetical protein